MFNKYQLNSLIISSTILVCFFIILSCFHSWLPITEKFQQEVALPNKKDDATLELWGFRFRLFQNDKKNLVLSGDKLTIQNRSIGYFRVALLKEVKIKNALMELYDSTPETDSMVGSSNNEVSNELEITGKNTKKEPSSFNGVFLEEFRELLKAKRAASIRLAPVRIEWHKNDTVVSRIAAEKSVLRLRKGEIKFRDSVRIESNGKTLTTDSIKFIPDRSKFKTNHYFTLKSSDKIWEGKGLIIDINLLDPHFL